MKLKVKDVNLSTGGPLVAVLHEKTARKLNIYPTDRLSIRRVKRGNRITSVVNISSMGIREDEIGLFEEILKKLNVTEGTHVEIDIAERPKSLAFIKKKLEGKELDEKEFTQIIKDVMNNEFSDVELTYFVSACYSRDFSISETVALTNAIVENGNRLHFKDKIILDKNCIGGIPGNRTSLILIPIIASLGYKMPKTSSRAITSAAGTADTFEILAPVTLSIKKIQKVVNKTNACIVWGGTGDLAGADDKLIKIRYPLSIDPTGMLIASILAKKKAAGATHVLIDIPWGKGAKAETKKQVLELKRAFKKVSKLLGLKIRIILTDGSHPIGHGIGPALEASDVISVLKGDGPEDLREKAVFMATEMLKLVGEKDPLKKVLDVLESGKAYEKFREIIIAQGGLQRPIIPKAKYFFDILATRNGVVKGIDNKNIAKVARFAGAPEDKAAGVYIHVHIKTKVKKGTILFTAYSNSQQNLEIVKKQLKEGNPISY